MKLIIIFSLGGQGGQLLGIFGGYFLPVCVRAPVCLCVYFLGRNEGWDKKKPNSTGETDPKHHSLH